MANYHNTLVILSFFFFFLFPLTFQAQIPSSEFIRSKCRSTEYPQLCFDSLSTYAPTINNSPIQLANAALSITLKTVQTTTAMMSRLSTSRNSGKYSSKDEEVMSDCVRSMSDSVEYLKRSLKEMGSLKDAGKKKMAARVRDVQTWVSTALTDESSCMDAFGPENGGKVEGVKGAVKEQVVKATQMTCNALGLVAGLGSN